MRMSRRNEIGQYITKKIRSFQESNDNASLAKLRRGVGHRPGELPELYGILLKDMPDSFWNAQGDITVEEWSCYISLTLFAWHQQGNDLKKQCVHTSEKYESIGKAMRRLVSAYDDSNAEERVQKKLQTLITSKDMEEFAYHLKGIITLIRKEGMAINYSELAEDIYSFQFVDSRNQISLKWGQDFYRVSKEEKNNE